MAFVMTLSPPYRGMDRILNVRQKVGPDSDCINDHDDVTAVQRLIALVARDFQAQHGFGLPQPSGRFDAVTGFYIYRLQVKNEHAAGRTIDGAVSPARGASYGAEIWSIVHFNWLGYTNYRTEWEALLSEYPAGS